MTVYAAVANGNLTSSSTWGAIDATSYLNSESGNTALTTSPVASATFTPGAITVDGIAVKIASRAASPTGTITVRLTAVSGLVDVGTVTVNVSDLPTCTATSGTTTPVGTAEGGWFFFKFGSPVLLVAATLYEIRCSTSNASQVNLWTNGTSGNWSRYLRTTTTGAPTTGDDMIIVGEWTAAATMTARTVTMDSTAATDYGNNTNTQVTPAMAIGLGGTLTWGTTASTNYILQVSGWFIIYNGGTHTMGALGAEVPSTSTAKLKIDPPSNLGSGYVPRNGYTATHYGLPRTPGKSVFWTRLTANLAAAGTTMTVADDTGWLNGDQIVLGQTAYTAGNQVELATLNANATTSGLSVSAGVSFAHSGTAPTQCYIGNLTRNVSIESTGNTNRALVFIANTGNFKASWVQFFQLGSLGTCAVDIETTTGSSSFSYCSIYGNNSGASTASGDGFNIKGGTANNINIDHCIGYGMVNTSSARGNFAINNATSGRNITFDSNISFSNFGNNCFRFAEIRITITNNIGVGNGLTGGFTLDQNATIGTFSGNVVFCSSGDGIQLNGTMSGSTFSNLTVINGNLNTGNGGITTSSVQIGLTFRNVTLFSCRNASFYFGERAEVTFDNVTSNASSSTNISTTYDIFSTGNYFEATFWSCSFSVPSGVYQASNYCVWMSNSTLSHQFNADNCYLEASTAVIGGFASAGPNSFFHSQRENRVYGNNVTRYPWGTVQSDNSIFYPPSAASGLSEKMTPASASVKTLSGPKIVPINSGQTTTFNIFVQKNGSYTGNQPRLVLQRQDSMGITSDTVLDTMTVSSGTWEQLIGTTPAAPADGAWSFIVDCDGTAGSVNADAWFV